MTTSRKNSYAEKKFVFAFPENNRRKEERGGSSERKES